MHTGKNFNSWWVMLCSFQLDRSSQFPLVWQKKRGFWWQFQQLLRGHFVCFPRKGNQFWIYFEYKNIFFCPATFALTRAGVAVQRTLVFYKILCEQKLPCVLNRMELSRWNSDEVVVVVGSLSVEVVPSKEPFLLFFKRCFTCKAIVSIRTRIYAIMANNPSDQSHIWAKARVQTKR